MKTTKHSKATAKAINATVEAIAAAMFRAGANCAADISKPELYVTVGSMQLVVRVAAR